MVAPTRFPSGISTYKPNNAFSNFPNVPNANQVINLNEFFPYVASNFTVTSTTSTIGAGIYNAVASALIGGFNGGVVSLAITTASGGLAALTANGNVLTDVPLSFVPGNQLWWSCQVAHDSNFLSDATVVSRYGLFSNEATPVGTVVNGVYFEKSAAAGGALNFVIKNKGLTGTTVTTTINNVADISIPSGIYGDTSSTVGTLTTAGSSNKYTSVVVATAGSGYQVAPLVRTLGAGAAAPYAQLFCQQQSNSLYAPYITNVGGTGYTTFTNQVNHWINLSIYYDGKGKLYIGVNGTVVASIGADGTTNLAAAGTATTGTTFYASNTAMTTSIAPVLPGPGTFDNIMPMSALAGGVGYLTATNATNIMFVDQMQIATEHN